MSHGPTAPEAGVLEVAVVGAGIAGLGLGIRMKRSGQDDFVILERADDVGGTWRDNVYPGAACDIPSRLYEYSFRPNPGWSHRFASAQEIHRYLYGMRLPKSSCSHTYAWAARCGPPTGIRARDAGGSLPGPDR